MSVVRRPALVAVRRELWPTFTLAWPVIVAELGWMLMGVVDTLMVGRVAPEAIGAVGLGSILFFSVAVFGMGLLLGLDTFVSQAYGAGNLRECHAWLRDGVHLAVAATLPLTLILAGLVALLPALGLHPAVQTLTGPYLLIVTASTLPLLLYAAFRRYLQALALVRPVMVTLILANVINAIANWVLVFGHLGVPALGVVGAAWATLASRTFMAAGLLGVILQREREHRTGLRDVSWRPHPARVWRLVRLGTPAATQISVEVGAFGAVAALAARIDPVAVAAHQVALNIASVTFMVPLGLSSAGAVRVGHAIGRGDVPGAGHAGWAALAVGGTFMATAAVVFLAVPGLLVRAFTPDAAVIATGMVLVRVAAAFQLFDGLQVVATGALRGLGDTRTPMLANIAGHWLIGLPIGAWCAFGLDLGVVGLWLGLSLSLILVGATLLVAWHRRIHRLQAVEVAGPAGRTLAAASGGPASSL
ncbi:MAG TPA: MATE family efflux transporter [Methylomirabilota bacterium]